MELTKKTARQSNFELLRILLMLMIVGFHYMIYSEFPARPTGTMNLLLYELFAHAGKVGVNGFVLISGYFLCTAKAFKPERLLKIFLQTLFYCVFGVALFLALPGHTLGLAEIIKYLSFVTNNRPWFAVAYMTLFVFSPFLNILIAHMDRKTYRRLLLLLFLVFSLWPSIRAVHYGVSNITWFVCLYLLAGYLRLHPEPIFDKKWLALGMAALSYIIIAGYPVVYRWINNKLPLKALQIKGSMHPQHTVPTLLCALGLFLFFKNLRIPSNRFINLAASTTFGVYLFHEFYLMRPLLWEDLFQSAPYYNRTPGFFLHTLWVVPCVFLMGMLTDLFRQYALERPLFWGIHRWRQRKERAE